MASVDKHAVIVIESAEQFDQLLAENDMVVVDFFTTWCPPCKFIAPKMEELAQENMEAGVKFAKFDVEMLNHEQSNDIKCVPTFKFYKGSKVVKTITGANFDSLKAAVEELKAGGERNDDAQDEA
jgi:thioredoxin 1